MRIALIGGAGFIGHHLALRLADLGHSVVIYDFMAVNNKFAPQVRNNPEYVAMIEERLSMLKGIPLWTNDARDYHMLSNVLGDFRPDAIVHLAAIAHIDRANKDPYSTFDHMQRTLENALDVAHSIKCPHFVFFSSSTAYGDFQKPVVDENESCRPKGIYGHLKLGGEGMVRAYGDLGLPWSIVRPCALYGPRCVSGRVTQKFVEMAHAGKTIRIDGDGEGRHDFTCIHDLVDGVTRLLAKGPTGHVFNITAGEARSVNELGAVVRRAYPDLRVEHGPADPQKPSRGTMSVKKAHESLGYAPQWPLERGMTDYIAWYRLFRASLERKAA